MKRLLAIVLGCMAIATAHAQQFAPTLTLTWPTYNCPQMVAPFQYNLYSCTSLNPASCTLLGGTSNTSRKVPYPTAVVYYAVEVTDSTGASSGIGPVTAFGPLALQ